MRFAVIGLRSLSKAGGVENYVREVYGRLAGRGHKITIFIRRRYSGDEDRRHQANIRVVALWTPNIPGIETAVYAFFATIRVLAGSYDVIHYQSLGSSIFSFLPRLRRQAIVTTVHSQDWSFSKWSPVARSALRFGEAQAIANSRGVITVSKALKDQLAAHYGTRAHHVSVIPNGVSRHSGDVPRDAAQIVNSLGLPSEQFALFVGRLVPEKNVHVIVEAFRKMPEITMAVVGAASASDAYCRQLRQCASKSKNIVFPGELYAGTLAAVFAKAALFINPSFNEGLPSVVLEALACDVPVILSDIPAHREIMGDQAVYFDPDDPDRLQDIVLRFFEDAHAAFRDRCRNQWSVTDRYDWETTADRTEQVLLHAANGVRTNAAKRDP